MFRIVDWDFEINFLGQFNFQVDAPNCADFEPNLLLFLHNLKAY